MEDGAVTVQTVIEVVRPLVNAQVDVQPSTPLLSSGLIDSLSTAELVDAVNKSFDLSLEIMDFGADNADTPEQLVALIRSARGQAL